MGREAPARLQLPLPVPEPPVCAGILHPERIRGAYGCSGVRGKRPLVTEQGQGVRPARWVYREQWLNQLINDTKSVAYGGKRLHHESELCWRRESLLREGQVITRQVND